jgi:hypothetical protein
VDVRSVLQPCIGAAAALLLAVSSLPASSETYYRWLNDRGTPVLSDRPPPAGTEYEVVSTGSSLTRRVEADEGAVPPEVEPRVGNEFNPVDTAEPPPTMKKNPEYCKRAKDNLQTLETFARLRVRDEQGEFRYLNDEERKAKIEEAKDQIAVHCE